MAEGLIGGLLGLIFDSEEPARWMPFRAGFRIAQLNIIEPSGGLFAVAGDEGDGRSAIEQVDGGLDLFFLDAQVLGDGACDRHGRHSK